MNRCNPGKAEQGAEPPGCQSCPQDTRRAAQALEVDDTDKTDGPRTRTARKLTRHVPCGAACKAGVEVGQA